ncbi:MAG: ABC transporter substrate-binding protein [Desulfobacterales bacterium]|nr:ABC transporter substrate-binding protein [Desulfobacterales bacterium]
MNAKYFFGVILCMVVILFTGAPLLAADPPEFIHVGATVSRSGHFSTEIGPFERLMNAWADIVNEQGGIMVKEYGKRLPVKFTIYDDKSDQAAARKYYERLITVDKVDLLLGPYSSPLTFAASTAAENHQVPFIAICANSPKIYTRGFQWIVAVIDIGPRYTYRYWDMIKDDGRQKSVGFVVEDTIHPLAVFKGSKKLAKRAGLQTLSEDIASASSRDFTPIITRLKNKDPDIVYVSSNIPFAINFMKQAREMNLNPREFHVIHHSGVFRDALGEGAENVVGQSYWVEGMKLGDAQLITDVLKGADIQEPMYPWAPAYVAAFQIVEAAVDAAGTLDNKTLMDTLKGLKVDTVLGRAWFNKTGYGSLNTYPSQIQNGVYKIIYPPEVATGTHVYPRKGK